MKSPNAITIFSLFMLLAVTAKSQSCGGAEPCPEGSCCSKFGWCGNTPEHCSPENCESQCPAAPPPPPPPPPPAHSDIPCGILNKGALCPLDMCCTLEGYCAESNGPLCIGSLSQSQCIGKPECGVLALGKPCPYEECCTIAGFCATIPSPACSAPFCQSGCIGGLDDPRISMVTTAIA